MDENTLNSAIDEITAGLGIGEELGDNTAAAAILPALGEEDLEANSEANAAAPEVKTPPEVEGTATPEADSSPDSGDPPPKTWRPEAAALWKDLPPAIRAEVQKREEDMFRGIEGYKQEASIGKALKEVISPYLQDMQAAGVNPMEQVSSLLRAHHILIKGSDSDRTEIFKHLLKEYNVNFAIPGGDAGTSTLPPDPRIEAVQKELAGIKSFVNNSQQQQIAQITSTLQKEIEDFASQPTNIYFNDVVDTMTQLIRAGVATNLKDAYDQAIWMNPAVREKELSRITAEKEATRKKTEEEALQKARGASAANLRTKANSGSGTAPIGTMDETLESTLKSIRSRTS